jgi:Transposase DDE domain
MFDLSSSWVEGSHCELAARGYSRDGKKGREQIEYGLLTDSEGLPLAIRVFPGNSADPAAFIEAVKLVRGKFGITELVMVGDRWMITSARIEALRELGGLSWITCLRAPAIRKLAAAGGPLQMSLFDHQDLAEITSSDYPGERLIACRNPLLAAERAHKREDLLTATEASWPRSKTSSARAGSRTRTRSASASGESSTGTRSPSTSSSISAPGGWTGGGTRPPSTPRPQWTASTSSAPR